MAWGAVEDEGAGGIRGSGVRGRVGRNTLMAECVCHVYAAIGEESVWE